MIPIWSKQQKALSFLVPVVMLTGSNDPHPGAESKHDVQAKKEFPTFCFSFQWGSQLDGWCWGLKVQSFSPHPPRQAPAHAYLLHHQPPRTGTVCEGASWGVHFCLLDWQLAVRSRNGRPRNGRLSLALCSAPKARAFQLPEIKVFLYSWEMHIWEPKKEKLQKAAGRSWYFLAELPVWLGWDLCENFSSAGAVVVNAPQGREGPSFMLLHSSLLKSSYI